MKLFDMKPARLPGKYTFWDKHDLSHLGQGQGYKRRKWAQREVCNQPRVPRYYISSLFREPDLQTTPQLLFLGLLRIYCPFPGTPKPDPTPWPSQPTIPLTPLLFPELSHLSPEPAVLPRPQPFLPSAETAASSKPWGLPRAPAPA